MNNESRIIVALDTDDPAVALDLAKKLSPHVRYFKFGLEFITAMLRKMVAIDISEGSSLTILSTVRELFLLLRDRIFWDGKFMDIPNTMAGAAAAVSGLEVSMFNVHASAGTEAMKAAVKNKGRAKVLAVTILTSQAEECLYIFCGPVKERVEKLAWFAYNSGVDGIICSAQEASMLREKPYMDRKLIVTPGIRPVGSDPGDQRRISTPRNAILAGADYLVVGRPITGALDPVAAAKAINEEVQKALAEIKK